MKTFRPILAIVALIAGCATQQSATNEPTGKWEWVNHDLYMQADAGEISEPELDHAFIVAKNQCKIQALQVPIPSPSCTQPPKQDCTGKTGFAKGFCQSYTPPERCNYSSVNAAEDAQVEIYDSCMLLSGWEREWKPFDAAESGAGQQIAPVLPKDIE